MSIVHLCLVPTFAYAGIYCKAFGWRSCARLVLNLMQHDVVCYAACNEMHGVILEQSTMRPSMGLKMMFCKTCSGAECF